MAKRGGFPGGEMPEMPEGERPEMPEMKDGEKPGMPEGEMLEMPDEERPQMPEDGKGGRGQKGFASGEMEANIEFVLSKESYQFGGITEMK
mgnify:CR=1 FL=1